MSVPPARIPAVSIVLGAVAAAGVAMAVVPQHALSIVRVLIAATAVTALVWAVAEVLGRVERSPDPELVRSPFDTTTQRRRFHRDRPADLDRVRGELHASTVRADVAPLSPLAARRLRAIADVVLGRDGLDIDDPAHADAVRSRLSPQALATITADRSTRRPGGAPAHPRRQASPAEVAATVHAVLDELEQQR